MESMSEARLTKAVRFAEAFAAIYIEEIPEADAVRMFQESVGNDAELLIELAADYFEDSAPGADPLRLHVAELALVAAGERAAPSADAATRALFPDIRRIVSAETDADAIAVVRDHLPDLDTRTAAARAFLA